MLPLLVLIFKAYKFLASYFNLLCGGYSLLVQLLIIFYTCIMVLSSICLILMCIWVIIGAIVESIRGSKDRRNINEVGVKPPKKSSSKRGGSKFTRGS